MPRAKNTVKLSREDLERFIAGENGDVKVKMVEWAKGELERRDRAGKFGGRPKNSQPDRHWTENEEVA